MRWNASHLRSLVLLAMVVCGTTSVFGKNPPSERIQWHADLGEAWKTTCESGRPLLLFVTVENCGYCTKMKNGTFTDEAVVSTISEAFVPTWINSRELKQMVDQLQIRLFPTTLIILPDYRVADRINGYLNARALQARLGVIDVNTHNQPR